MERLIQNFPAFMLRGALALAFCLAKVTLVAGAVTPQTSSANSNEWPLYRGNPALTGVAAWLCPGQSPSLLWNFKTGGPVKSSAVIGGGKVFIGSNDGQVVCA